MAKKNYFQRLITDKYLLEKANSNQKIPIKHGFNFAINTITGEKIFYSERTDNIYPQFIRTCTIN